MAEQYSLDFDTPFDEQNTALWTPRDIWLRLNQRVLEYFKEDTRIERKGRKRVNREELAIYLSCFSNTHDGGIIIYGISDKGTITGCSNFSTTEINDIHKCHVRLCPEARPEVKKFPVIIDGQPDLCIAVYVPYIGKLVETNKGEAWIRYGDEKHKMSEAEKQDFRSSLHQLSWELETAPYKYPDDFDLRIIQDFSDAFRSRESREAWTNEEVLIDRFLLKKDGKKFLPLNSLVLLSGKQPRKTVPGSRVRVQRFETEDEGQGDSYRPVIDKSVEGNLPTIIKGAVELISTVIFDVTWLDGEKFVTTQEYPFQSWSEALINACVHRSYSYSGADITVKLFPNRMEIESPGAFVPPVNENNIYETRNPRNPHVGDALRYLGYVRMAREGARRIREGMREQKLPDPAFRQQTTHGVVVRVTLMNLLRKRATDRDVAAHFGVEAWKALKEHEVKIVAYAFRNGGYINVSEAQRLTGRTWATSKKDLDRLTARDVLIFEAGSYVRDSKARYRLTGKKANGEKGKS